MPFRTIDDLAAEGLAGKRVLVRVDLNVPMQDGKVTDDTRIQAALPTINDISKAGGKVILLAHFGRPKGKRVDDMSLAPVAQPLSDALGRKVDFVGDCVGLAVATAIARMNDGDVLLLENTRFHPGEDENDPAFTRALAENGDVYVNDAFSVSHRASSSTEGLAHILPAAAGRTMEAELKALDAALGNPQRPVAALVGGAKVSSKLDVLGNLVGKVDVLLIGGGMANTFLNAQGVKIGKSLCEADLAATALAILNKAQAAGTRIILPVDGLLSKEFKAGAPHRVAANGDIADDEMILDAGPATIAEMTEALKGCATLVWNGPLGAFEIPPFDTGTVALARAAASLTKSGRLLSVAGGGDTVAALNHAGAAQDFSFISTAGGAFLEWLEGKELPGVKALNA